MSNSNMCEFTFFCIDDQVFKESKCKFYEPNMDSTYCFNDVKTHPCIYIKKLSTKVAIYGEMSFCTNKNAQRDAFKDLLEG